LMIPTGFCMTRIKACGRIIINLSQILFNKDAGCRVQDKR